MLPKLLVAGFKRHGKDTVAEFLTNYGYVCVPSSEFVTSTVIMPYFESIGKPYSSIEECFNDRDNHRKIWFDLIEAYNTPDGSRLSQELLKHGNVYVGMRSEYEFQASKHLYDYVIWVDASKRLPPEDKSSCTINPDNADFILDNNGTLENLENNVRAFIASIDALT